jgi:hypothetical protein
MMLPFKQNLILTGQMLYNKTQPPGCMHNTSYLLSQIKLTKILPSQISYLQSYPIYSKYLKLYHWHRFMKEKFIPVSRNRFTVLSAGYDNKPFVANFIDVLEL